MCRKCETPKPVDQFQPRKPGQGWLDSTGRPRHSYCRDCEKKRLKDWRESDIDLHRERSREAYHRRMARVKRSRTSYADLRERRRLYAWEQRRRNGEREVPNGGLKAPDFEKDLRLPIGPFKAWLEAKLKEYPNRYVLAAACGLTDRRVYAALNDEQAEVSLNTVDRALTSEGSTFLFMVYPELYPGLDTMALADVLMDVVWPAEDDDQWLRPRVGVIA